MHVIVGKRGSGKSTAITALIGDGTGALVIVSTDEDARYHRAASPNATVIINTDITTVVTDNAEIEGAHIQPHIASVNHPCAVPRDATGTLTMLCNNYYNVDTVMKELRSRFAS